MICGSQRHRLDGVDAQVAVQIEVGSLKLVFSDLHISTWDSDRAGEGELEAVRFRRGLGARGEREEQEAERDPCWNVRHWLRECMKATRAAISAAERRSS
jgi:hypothetical protein